MRANINLTRGQIFADAASAALAPFRGRAEAYKAVEEAAESVRSGDDDLHSVLMAAARSADEQRAIEAAFNLEPAIAAAAQWVEPVCVRARAVRDDLLQSFKDS